MQLRHIPQATALDILPTLSPDWRDGAAANDCGIAEQDGNRGIPDINALVVSVAGRVSAFTADNRADIELDLCPCVPAIAGDPGLTAFAVAGVLVAQLRTIEEGGSIKIKTEALTQRVKVSILADCLPLLAFVRAVEAEADGDPTMDHCRRLVEEVGGWMELRADDELVGFELNFPALPLTRSTEVRTLDINPGLSTSTAVAIAS